MPNKEEILSTFSRYGVCPVPAGSSVRDVTSGGDRFASTGPDAVLTSYEVQLDIALKCPPALGYEGTQAVHRYSQIFTPIHQIYV
jgi:hypothetical protein